MLLGRGCHDLDSKRTAAEATVDGEYVLKEPLMSPELNIKGKILGKRLAHQATSADYHGGDLVYYLPATSTLADPSTWPNRAIQVRV